jgi:hypothetical protein
MANEIQPTIQRSGLIIDVDYQSATAVLVGQTEGTKRFIAGATTLSTAMPPINEQSVGVRQVIRTIEDTTGVQLTGPEGIATPARGFNGVDVVAVTGQPVAPLRLSVASTGQSSMSAALEAAARRTITVVDNVTSRVRTGDGGLSGVLFESAIREFLPDAVLLLEGDSAESEWSTAIGTLVELARSEMLSLVIIVAGDRYQQHAAQLFGESADLRGIDPAEFTVSDIAAALESELQGIYDSRVVTQEIAQTVEPARFVNRMRAGDLVTRFLARRREEAVAYLDVADGLILHTATPEVGDVHVRPDMDLYRNIRTMLERDPDDILRWLPMTFTAEELSHWILNRALRPHGVADTSQDRAVERALLIEMARTAWITLSGSDASTSNLDLIVGGRPFSTMSPGVAALTLLDIFQPSPATGLVEIILDSDSLVAAAGAIGEMNPVMAADLVEHDLLSPFATVFVVSGESNEGDVAVRGKVQSEDGQVTQFTVPYGSVHRIPVSQFQTTTLMLTCEATFRVGDQTQLPDISLGRDGMLQVGDGGVIIDARGRPMGTASDSSLRAPRIASWLEDVGFTL